MNATHFGTRVAGGAAVSAAMKAAPTPRTIGEDRLAALAKALGHPARVRILRLLGARATCVTGELAPELGLAASTVSEHLRILREAGLIETESAEGRPCYCLSKDGLRSLIAGVNALLDPELVGETGLAFDQAPAEASGRGC